uniref:Uncharacterized protein n=1 Tax=Buteo japonicus TaxID=224669 RepID=A0A8B9YX53_9AVES
MPSSWCTPSCWPSTPAATPAPSALPTCSSSSSWCRTCTPARAPRRSSAPRSPSVHLCLGAAFRALLCPSRASWVGAGCLIPVGG